MKAIGLSYVLAPLHKVQEESRLASGVFSIAVRDKFPIDGWIYLWGMILQVAECIRVLKLLANPFLYLGRMS